MNGYMASNTTGLEIQMHRSGSMEQDELTQAKRRERNAGRGPQKEPPKSSTIGQMVEKSQYKSRDSKL
jgi:hypothetical protein